MGRESGVSNKKLLRQIGDHHPSRHGEFPIYTTQSSSSANGQGHDRLRALNMPQPVEVREDQLGEPTAVRSGGRWLAVARVEETWRIDDEWWRERPISRLYMQVTLEDGVTTVLFKDLVGGAWHQQRL